MIFIGSDLDVVQTALIIDVMNITINSTLHFDIVSDCILSCVLIIL